MYIRFKFYCTQQLCLLKFPIKFQLLLVFENQNCILVIKEICVLHEHYAILCVSPPLLPHTLTKLITIMPGVSFVYDNNVEF